MIRSISSPKKRSGKPCGPRRRENFKRIAAHAEDARAQLHIIALVLALDQLAQQRIAPVQAAHFQIDHRAP
jgi:hypothetical protein